MNKKEAFNKFKPGVEFIIESKPRYWSSMLNKNNPLEKCIEYPYHGKIVHIDMSDEFYFAIDDGYYGWSLTNLLENDLIIIDPKYIRKQKLLTLKKLNK